MKRLLNNYWFKLLLAPVFTLMSLGMLVLPSETAIIFICAILWFVSGGLIWVVATKNYLEKE